MVRALVKGVVQAAGRGWNTRVRHAYDAALLPFSLRLHLCMGLAYLLRDLLHTPRAYCCIPRVFSSSQHDTSFRITSSIQHD